MERWTVFCKVRNGKNFKSDSKCVSFLLKDSFYLASPLKHKTLMSSKRSGQRHRFYKVLDGERRVAFIILQICTVTIFIRKSIQQLPNLFILHLDVYCTVMKNTASNCVKGEHTWFSSQVKFWTETWTSQKKKNNKPLSMLKNAGFQKETFLGYLSQSNFVLAARHPSRC